MFIKQLFFNVMLCAIIYNLKRSTEQLNFTGHTILDPEKHMGL